MNPLDLRGPEFLAFYLAYGLVVLIAVLWVKNRLDQGPGRVREPVLWRRGHFPRESDAYAIAYARGGEPQVAESALARLVRDEVIGTDGTYLWQTPKSKEADLSTLERAIVDAIPPQDGRKKVGSLIGAIRAVVERESPALDQRLEREGVLLTPDELRPFRILAVVGLLVLAGMGLLKLMVAFSRGRSNVGFLIFLILVFSVIALIVTRRSPLTTGAREYLGWLRDSHAGLLSAVNTDARSAAGEAALAAAIFGLAAMPGHEFVRLRRTLHPARSSSSCGSSGCGSGGDGGSGCGGGGGCGGCGG